MLDSIRAFVGQKILKPAAEPGAPAVEATQLAACALLLELAHADGEFTAPERAHIEGALSRHFGLESAAVQELMALAEAARAQSIDQFQFTRVISANYDLGQKMVLAEVMWGVILADGKLAEHEAYLVRKLANLLELQPGYLAQARRAASPPE
jgi:uncharacterized tellurite resistance protein B-like protein